MIEIPGQVTSTCWGTTAVLACLTRQPLIGCQRAAENGVLIAQLALAQHYSSNGRNAGDRCNSYVWYSIAMQQLLQGWKDITQEMTVDQVEEAEQRAARWLGARAPTNRLAQASSFGCSVNHLKTDCGKGLLEVGVRNFSLAADQR